MSKIFLMNEEINNIKADNNYKEGRRFSKED